ncbi:GNAT family N-acetyltransferase [Flavobacterium rakeshii]|uniref:GNAT family N-acetyltransferase n=1 Tax=Flavobacterium rakeshii TaxID=1038845 RepID=UPI002E7B6260|nr:GNAT family N-acetyltransferase [Flavobacterium rakeshii]MEE1899309.1 GNAT family N-acetyltransferase [Flavobacterium rakeshii]
MEIIKAGFGDYNLVHTLAEKVWPQTYKNILTNDQITYMFEMMYSQTAYNEQIEKKGHEFLLIRDESGYLGFASYELNYNNKPITKVHKIYVLPQTQGKGAGRALIDKISQIAADNNNTVISLNVNRYNTAIGFYEKIGFVKAGQEDIDIGNGYLMEDYIMQKAV